MSATQAKQAAPPPVAALPSRMRLDGLIRGKLEQPYRVLFYAPEGLGKSTFGSNAPEPIFLGAEEGTAQLDVVRFPTPTTWGEVLEAVRVLTNDAHSFQTLVIDTLDWVEPLVWRHVYQRDGVASIEEVGGGYGKGYTAAIDEWRLLLAALERLRAAKRMHVLLLAHSWIRKFQNPQGEDFDRYELKLNQKAAGLLKEWPDAVLFANYETFAVKDRAKRVRGVSTGARVLYTQRTAAYDAKNRYGLPEQLALSWEEFDRAAKKGEPAPPGDLRAEIERKAKLLGAEREIAGAIERAAGDATKLAILNSYMNTKLAEAGKEA